MMRLVVLLLAGLTLPVFAAVIDWPAALRGVAAGDVDWLERTPELAAVADIKQAQELEDALAVALTTNTRATLVALRKIDAGNWPHMIGTDIVCTPPTDKPSAEVIAFYQRTRQALLKTSEGAQCLWVLEASWEELNADKARQGR
ncbi:hypothetical protein [Atlantibacter sp.]|uniref:hypothetical protein n=1 Tax=Atlantibacter sp. TaxID=1903473 RepID=UPI0028AB892F|nr:hypothetical protein [Atlantibacter sp.]